MGRKGRSLPPDLTGPHAMLVCAVSHHGTHGNAYRDADNGKSRGDGGEEGERGGE
jgi:hypothetical protein